MPARHRLLDFSGAMQTTTSRFLQSESEVELSINARYEKIGSFEPRLGYQTTGVNNIGSTSSSALYDSGSYLYGHCGTKIRYNNNASNPVAGTWTDTTGGTDPTASMVLNFVRYKQIDDLYVVGATENPTTAADFLVTQVVGAVSTAPQTKADANTAQFPRAKFAVRWKDRIYFGYCYSTWYVEGALIKPTRVVYTNVPQTGALDGQTINDVNFTNFFDVDDPITGMAATTEYLIIWTKSGMWKYDGTTLKRFYEIGCVSHKSIVQIDIYTFWLSRDGIQVESGGKPQLLTTKVKPQVDAISSLTSCFSWPDQRKYNLWLGIMTLDSNSYRNVVMVYDMDQNQIYLDKYTLPSSGGVELSITCGGAYDDGTRNRAYIGGANGKVYRLSNSLDTTPIYSDGTDSSEIFPIEMKVITKRYDEGAPEEQKDIPKVTVFSERPGGTKIKSKVGTPQGRKGFWEPFGILLIPVEQLSISPRNFNDIQFQFSWVGTTQGPQINGLVFGAQQTTNDHP